MTALFCTAKQGGREIKKEKGESYKESHQSSDSVLVMLCWRVWSWGPAKECERA